MAADLVAGQKAFAAASAAGTSLGVAMPGSNTDANEVIVGVICSADTGTCTGVTDSAGNNFPLEFSYQDSLQTSRWLYCFRAVNILGGADTITAAFTAGTTARLITVAEFYGLDNAAAKDQTKSASGTGNINSGLTGPTVDDGEIVWVMSVDNSGDAVADVVGGYTQLHAEGTVSTMSEYLVQPTAGTIAGTGIGGAAGWGVIVVTFRPQIGEPGGPIPRTNRAGLPPNMRGG